MRAGMMILLVAALGAGACDDGNDASVKCDRLEQEVCKRAVECGAQNNEAECLTDAKEEVMCAMAKSVKPTFDTCLSDLRQATCDTLMRSGLPETCETVILF